MFIDDESHVNNIAVDPAWQGRGLGAALMLDLVRTGLAHGARHLTLEVRVGNDPALALYRRFGMAPVGVRPNYYPDTGDDALIMWARDIDSEAYGRASGRDRARSAGGSRGDRPTLTGQLAPGAPPCLGHRRSSLRPRPPFGSLR